MIADAEVGGMNVLSNACIWIILCIPGTIWDHARLANCEPFYVHLMGDGYVHVHPNLILPDSSAAIIFNPPLMEMETILNFL